MACSGNCPRLSTPAYRVGQWLYWAQNCPLNEPHPVVILKVGRKWLTLGNGTRVDKRTLASGPSDRPAGQAYLSEKEYHRARAAVRQREVLRKLFAGTSVSDQDIARVSVLLGVSC